jgi:predicted nuclease of predicted toxin-antitoxin system
LRFFIDEDLPRSIAGSFRQSGYDAVDIRDTTLRGAKDQEIAEYVKKNDLCLITGDYDFADIRNYPPAEYAGLVVINAGKDATAAAIRILVIEFLKQTTVISELSGKLAIVEPGRIRVRKSSK